MSRQSPHGCARGVSRHKLLHGLGFPTDQWFFPPVSPEENYRIVLAPQLIKGSQAMSPEVRQKAKQVSANACSPGCRTNYSRLVTQFGRHNRSSMQLIFGHEFLVFPAYPATNDNELW